MSEENTTNRRDFIVGAATGVASVALFSTAACAEETPDDQKPKSLSDNVGATDSGKGVDVTVNDVKGAEKLMDVSYTAKEREQIVEGIESQIEAMRAARAFAAPNELAPAQVFSPRIPGKAYAEQPNSVTLIKAAVPQLPSHEDDIAFAPLTHLSAWIKNKMISSVELTEIYLKRIEKFGPKLECFVTVTADLARRQAITCDVELGNGRYRGPLHGIPYGVKDLMDTNGIKTTWGAMPYKDRVAKDDAIIVKRLREAGAVLIGKTTCGALAYGDIWFDGKTRNPWNVEEGSSGSSAGSASATAGGLVGFSIGTETLGSIVSPSQRCGATGLRPSFGRVARTGTMALCWSLDKIGPICRGVEDTALVLQAINGGDVTDPSSMTTGFHYNGAKNPRKLTIGFAPEWFESANDVELRAFETARSLGFKLKEIKVPEINFGAMVQNLIAEGAAAF
ncbi:MAG: amidase, partial [Sphingomonadales bacterium]|nr:amidase [Sphingomonadales bacterium]